MGRPKGSKNINSTKTLYTCPQCHCSKFLCPSQIAERRYCSRKCRAIMISKRYQGAGNPFFGKTFKHTEFTRKWKIGRGFITPLIKRIRNSSEYEKWRKAVFKRDNYTCTICRARSGNGKRVMLNADHIKSFTFYEDIRFDVNNGRTLCEECHKKTDNFGHKAVLLFKQTQQHG